MSHHQLGKIYWIALVVYMISAFFSVGYIHPDEHFQILEFASFKQGNISQESLAWEYKAQIRPSLQPLIALGFIKTMNFLGLSNPFTQALILRVLTALLSLLVLKKLNDLLLPAIESEKVRFAFVFTSLLLWVQPFVMVHFSSETFSTLALLTTVYFLLKHLGVDHIDHIYKPDFKARPNSAASLIYTGLLFAFAFFLRFQLGFAILGIGLWLLVIARPGLKFYLITGFSFLLGLAACLLMDSMFYGELVITPYNYFTANIVDNVAANWGTKPWWAYFPMFIEAVAHPIGVVLLLLLPIGLRQASKHVFTYMLIPFLVAHMLVGHKEIRFLIPILYGVIFLASVGLDKLYLKQSYKKFLSPLLKILLAVNMLLLVYRIFVPAQEAILYQRYVYNYTKNTPNPVLICVEEDIYNLVGVESSFYKPKELTSYVAESETLVEALLRENEIEEALLFRKNHEPIDLESFTLEDSYTVFPDWLLQNNTNDWQSRARIWSIVKIRKK